MINYELDAQDSITQVGGSWDRFAEANDGATLTQERVLGRPLFGFIAGGDVAQLYRALFQKARKERRSLAFTFRCDAPRYRRRMLLQIKPLAGERLRLKTTALEESEREPVALLDVHMPRSEEVVVVCVICNDVRSDDGLWVPLEEESTRKRWLLESEAVPRISHSYCPRCLTEQLELLGPRA